MISTKWIERFVELSRHIATWSKDPSTQVGALLVNMDKNVLALGYNGFPRGMDDAPALYHDRPFKYKHILHAETNACLNALSSGSRVEESILFVTHPPCTHCTGVIKQAGVVACIFPMPDDDFLSRWPLDDTVDHFKRVKLGLAMWDGDNLVWLNKV